MLFRLFLPRGVYICIPCYHLCCLSELAAEMVQAAGDIGTQWILDLRNGIVKEGCIPEDWKSSVVLPIYKGKGDPIECGSYRGIKLLEHESGGKDCSFVRSLRRD